METIVFTADSFSKVFAQYESFIYNNTIEIIKTKVNSAKHIKELILIYTEL